MLDALVLGIAAVYIGVALYERQFGRALFAAWLVALGSRLVSDGEGTSATVSWLSFVGLTVIGITYLVIRRVHKRRSAAEFQNR